MCSTPAVTEIPRTTHTIEFPYTRTLGPVIGPFLTGLRDQRILGARTGDGRVLVPPLEWDPATGEALATDLVEVGPGGTSTRPSPVRAPRIRWSRNPVRNGPMTGPRVRV